MKLPDKSCIPLARTRSSCQTRSEPGRLQRQLAAQNREWPWVPGEVVAANDVEKAESPVEPPGAIGLAKRLRGREQHVVFAALGKQPTRQRLSQTSALCPRVDMQLGQLEVAGHQLADLRGGEATALQAGHDLLLPPLIGRAAV